MKKVKRLLSLALASAMLSGSAMAADKVVKLLSIATNIPGERDYIASVEASFEAANPGVDVQIQYMDDESFKLKLPTLLQSKDKPDIFYSWAGSLLSEQIEQGVVRDITDRINATGCAANHSEGGKASFSKDGRVYGLPMYASNVVLWYNKDLAKKAGINPQEISTWDDFLGQVEDAKTAGVTPIVVGAKDKWPVMFYQAYLTNRMLGGQAIPNALAGKDGGFNNKDWIAVRGELARLGKLEPFQPGYLDTTYDKATGLFGDGLGIFHLMGNWDVGAQRAAASDKKGLSDEQIGHIPFPVVKNGKGDPNATFGGMNGWAVSAGASDTAVDFLCHYVNKENQTEGGRLGFWLPVAVGSDSKVENPINKWVAGQLGKSSGHTLFDQGLPTAINTVQDDTYVDLVSGETTPEEASELVEDERQNL